MDEFVVKGMFVALGVTLLLAVAIIVTPMVNSTFTSIATKVATELF